MWACHRRTTATTGTSAITCVTHSLPAAAPMVAHREITSKSLRSTITSPRSLVPATVTNANNTSTGSSQWSLTFYTIAESDLYTQSKVLWLGDARVWWALRWLQGARP